MKKRAYIQNEFSTAGKRLTIRESTRLDDKALIGLHNDVFNSSVHDDWFDWKYDSGNGESVSVWHNDAMIAHCGGVPRKLWHQGKLFKGIQIGDVMVSPNWRGILTRTGPFYRVSDAFYKSRLQNRNSFELGFGFPSQRHIKLALKVGLLMDAGPVWQAAWDAYATDNRNFKITPLKIGPRFVLKYFFSCSRMHSQLHQFWHGERSLSYLYWRYIKRPSFDYQFWLIENSTHPSSSGIAVTRYQPGPSPDLLWLDWIGDTQILDSALKCLRSLASDMDCRTVSTWGTTPVIHAMSSYSDFNVSEVARIGIPTSSKECDRATQGALWWLMAGDTDFL